MEKTQPAQLTLEDFMRRYSDEGPFEIINDEVISVTPQVTRSARIAFRLARMLASR